MVEQEEHLLEIAQDILKNADALAAFHKPLPEVMAELSSFPSIALNIEEHLRRFEWVTCGYADEPPWKKEDVVNALRKTVLQPVGARLQELHTYPLRLKKQKSELFASLRLSPAYSRLANALSDAVYYKDYLRGVMNKAQFDSQPLFAEIAKRMCLSIRQVKTFTPEEFEEAWRQKTWDASIFSRLTKYVCYPYHSQLVFSSAERARRIQAEILEAVAPVVRNELKGFGVMAGLVRGPVRVVNNPALVHRHDHGFVLVTSMTTPDFVPVMKRALAVVTDEGGITCHAAIVSRELGVPCVVGTKQATRLFKNGDVVEVDANRGVIRRV